MSKKISSKEKLQIFEDFFFRLNFHRYVSCNDSKVHAMLAIADEYVNAHAASDTKDANVNAALEKMKVLP